MRVLILYASFGSGHRRAAEAVAEAFQTHGIPVEVRDLLDFMPPLMARFYAFAYEFMITSGRELWRLTYNLMNYPRTPYRPAIALMQRWQFRRLKKFVQHGAFTHIISTHFTPSALLADWATQGELHCKIFSVITDHETHRCWKRTGLDHYFTASAKVASEMNAIGVPEKDLTVSGIPISEAFSMSLSKEESRKHWNLSDHSTVVLVLCSAVTLKKSIQMLKEFAEMDGDYSYVVVSGSDSKKENHLKQLFANDHRFTILGFTRRIAELMIAADVIVTKPGGLIVSEALGIGRPQILLEPIPGQEEANAKYAVEAGAAVCCLKSERGIYRKTLTQLVENRDTLIRMSTSALQAGKPDAASRIAGSILAGFVVS